MSLLVVGTVAFDAIETLFAKTDKIVGAATYRHVGIKIQQYKPSVVVGDDFSKSAIDMMQKHQMNIDGLQIKKEKKHFFGLESIIMI